MQSARERGLSLTIVFLEVSGWAPLVGPRDLACVTAGSATTVCLYPETLWNLREKKHFVAEAAES